MKYYNPIIPGFHPDPSICRAGQDYYLVTSSFEYFPGIPIFHSRDLVNWTQIGNCVQRSEEYPMSGVKDSGGIWAPSIRYHKGTFYVTATLEGCGNFIICSENPQEEWSAPIWIPVGGIDPSLMFDGDKAYYCTNQSLHFGQEEITLEEINISTGALLSEQRTIWKGMGGGFLEAPHIYHIGEWYYLLAAEGGTNFNHMITAARSREIWGPYEDCPYNPVLTNVHDTSKEVQCAGHGDLFQDHRGNWWIVHLAIRLSRRTMSHLGRETFLTPVIWKDGWPVAENHRKAVLCGEGPLWEKQTEPKEWSADFYSEVWEPQWIFLRRHQKADYRRGGGTLKLFPSKVTLGDCASPTFAAVRQRDFACELEASFCFETYCEGDMAGIAVVLSSEFYYLFYKKRTDGGEFLVLEKRAEDFSQIAWQEAACAGRIDLRITADKEKYHFFYRQGVSGEGKKEPEKSWKKAADASTRFLSCELAGKCFTGTVMGLYTAAKEKTKAVMEVFSFKTAARSDICK